MGSFTTFNVTRRIRIRRLPRRGRESTLGQSGRPSHVRWLVGPVEKAQERARRRRLLGLKGYQPAGSCIAGNASVPSTPTSAGCRSFCSSLSLRDEIERIDWVQKQPARSVSPGLEIDTTHPTCQKVLRLRGFGDGTSVPADDCSAYFFSRSSPSHAIATLMPLSKSGQLALRRW